MLQECVDAQKVYEVGRMGVRVNGPGEHRPRAGSHSAAWVRGGSSAQ